MSKIPSPPLQMKRVELGAWEVVLFSASEEIAYSFNSHFDIFWNSIYLIVVPQFG